MNMPNEYERYADMESDETKPLGLQLVTSLNLDEHKTIIRPGAEVRFESTNISRMKSVN